MKRFGRRLGWTLLILILACAGVVLAAVLLGDGGDDGLFARLLLKPGHIIIERRPGL
jgi:hypothetical protein